MNYDAVDAEVNAVEWGAMTCDTLDLSSGLRDTQYPVSGDMIAVLHKGATFAVARRLVATYEEVIHGEE